MISSFFCPRHEVCAVCDPNTRSHIRWYCGTYPCKNVHLKTGKATSLQANFTIDGLPYIEKTIFNLDVANLSTNSKDVETLVPQLGNLPHFMLPEHLDAFGQVQYSGKLSGYYHNFHADGLAQTELGHIRTVSDIRIKPTLQFAGNAQSPSFELGKFIKTTEIGSSGLDVKFDGRITDSKDVQLELSGRANSFFFKNYPYTQIDFEGALLANKLTAVGHVEDTHAQLAFDGTVDWSTTETLYNFSSTIDHLSLKQTHLLSKDSITIRQTDVNAELQGNTLNNLTGFVKADQISLSSTRGDFTIGKFQFESSGNEQSKLLRIDSDVLNMVMAGQIDLNSIGAYFTSLAMRYAPAINIDTKPYNPQNFDLNVKIKSFDPISALFDPDLKLDNGATLYASFSSQNYLARFEAFSPILTYKGITVTNLKLDEDADNKTFDLNLDADRISFSDSVYVDNIRIKNTLANDSLHFNILLSEESRPNHLLLNGNIHFAYNKPAYIRFDQSKIVLNNEHWDISKEADLRVSKGKFYLNNLLFKRDRQEVLINGVLSDDETDNLILAFKEFNLASFSGITSPMGINLQGHLNGDVKLNSVFKRPNFSTHITTTPITYNNLPLGILAIHADYEPQTGLVKLISTLQNIDGRGVELSGYYDVRSKTDALQLRGKIKETDLLVVQPFLKTLVSNLYGKVSGDIAITGTLNHPVISGSAQIIDASFMVNYLQTKYNMANQNAFIDNNIIHLNNLRFTDSKGMAAIGSGTVDLNTLADPTLNINVVASNLQILNTTRKDNELFFGTAFASGKFGFKGPTSAINIAIDATSNPNTAITIPFNSSLKVSENDFIYFTSTDSTKNKEAAQRKLFKGLTMNMDLNITPDAEINLENNVGSLKGSGRGNLSLRISNLGDFEMFGDYHILSGKFHFTAQDFFNKYFDLKEGGTIRWAGNPSEAVVNLAASYQQRTSVGPLYNAAGRTENNDRVLAQADMMLKGTLSQPEISFGLTFPQDPYIKDELQSYFLDGNNINQQAISLIVRRSFTPASTQEFGKEVNNTLISAGTEIAFNQLNSIISQSLNMNFFDLNIRSFNDASASLRFFDDRLTLTGGVSDRSKNTLMTDLTPFSDQVATDAEVTFKLRKDGSLILRAYNRLNTRNFLFTPYSDYISAAGVVYRQEFNSLSEFWRKMWIWNDKRDKKDILPVDSTATQGPLK